LKAAYVDARYSMKYSITREDLEILAGHVKELGVRVERVCRERIAAMVSEPSPPPDGAELPDPGT
jgi:hypothetical protein